MLLRHSSAATSVDPLEPLNGSNIVSRAARTTPSIPKTIKEDSPPLRGWCAFPLDSGASFTPTSQEAKLDNTPTRCEREGEREGEREIEREREGDRETEREREGEGERERKEPRK